jgi:hypothetical protein
MEPKKNTIDWFVIANPNEPDAELIADTELTTETVEWMAKEVRHRKVLDHHEAAKATLEKLGLQAVMGGLVLRAHHDGNGSSREVYRFSPRVLQAFRELTRKTVRWGKKDRYWVTVKPKHVPPA